MAKWGEGDPRWIVEERADATNVNNWHWWETTGTFAHFYSSHLDANMLKNTRLAVVCESTASRTLSTEENIVLATEQLAATGKVQVVVFGFILIAAIWLNGPLASSQVYSCHAFAASFMWRLSGRYISIILRKSCLPLHFLGCQLLLSDKSLRFCSCSVSAAWTLNVTEEEMLSDLEQVKCWSGWLIRLTLLMKVYWWNRNSLGKLKHLNHFLVFVSISIHKFKGLFTVDSKPYRS